MSRSLRTGTSDGKKQSRNFASAKQYTDWREMLDSEKLDVVSITNNNGERAGAIVEAAKRKINVVAEKPLAIDKAGSGRSPRSRRAEQDLARHAVADAL